MKVDHTDVTQLATQFTPLIEEANVHLDAIFHYFQPAEQPRTDFSDMKELMRTASKVGRLLEICAETVLWARWGQYTVEAIAEHGADATIEHVHAKLANMLTSRTTHLLDNAGYGPVAQLYSNLVTQHIAQGVNTCRRLMDADSAVHTLIDRVAPSLGMTSEACYAALRAGDTDIQRALGQAALGDAETKLAAQGLEIPAGLRQMLMAASGTDTPPPSGDLADIDPNFVTLLGGMGIDAESLRNHGGGVYTATISAMAHRDEDHHSNIKVG